MRAQERGEAEHLFPVDPAKVRTGEIPLKDVPYMQRGGSWTNSDLTGKGKGWMNTGFGMYAFNDGKAKTAKANKFDKMYNPGSKRDGFSVGIFGEAGALDWTGRGARSGGGAEAGSTSTASPRARRKRHLGGHADAMARRRRRGPEEAPAEPLGPRRRAQDRRGQGEAAGEEAPSASSRSVARPLSRDGAPKIDVAKALNREGTGKTSSMAWGAESLGQPACVAPTMAKARDERALDRR